MVMRLIFIDRRKIPKESDFHLIYRKHIFSPFNHDRDYDRQGTCPTFRETRTRWTPTIGKWSFFWKRSKRIHGIR